MSALSPRAHIHRRDWYIYKGLLVEAMDKKNKLAEDNIQRRISNETDPSRRKIQARNRFRTGDHADCPRSFTAWPIDTAVERSNRTTSIRRGNSTGGNDSDF